MEDNKKNKLRVYADSYYPIKLKHKINKRKLYLNFGLMTIICIGLILGFSFLINGQLWIN